jgi:hypothetical protein
MSWNSTARLVKSARSASISRPKCVFELARSLFDEDEDEDEDEDDGENQFLAVAAAR